MTTRHLVAVSSSIHRAKTSLSSIAVIGVFAACTSGGFFSLGPRPAELAGVWIDSSLASATDTVAWVLDPDGTDRTLRVSISRDSAGHPMAKQSTQRYGYWYLNGAMSDTAHRALCFKMRPRDGASCYHFQLDTVSGSAAAVRRRRLTIVGYRGQRHTRDRTLLERLP